MDERAALETSAVRTIESRDQARALLPDADRAWASRAAAEVVGESASAETFIARRAALALERLATRHPALPRAVRALRWRRWVGPLAVATAFVAGIAVDRVGAAGRIDLLAPPVFGLLLWNLAVYAALVAGFVVRYGEPARIGPLRRAVIRVAGHLQRQFADLGPPRPAAADDGVAGAIAALTRGWGELAAPLYAARAAAILHACAAALTLGVVAGLYLRGLAFEYRATWESTFLGADTVRTLLAAALAPGAWLTGIAVPDATRLAAIRAPAGENAALWLHLIAATLAAVVVVPRLLLAAGTGIVARHRARHLPLALADPYCQRLLRGFRGGPVRVRVLPYSYTLAPPAVAGLEALVARTFGGSAALTIEAPVAYGDEDGHAARDDAGDTALLVVFNLAATPEREVQGRFVETLAARRAAAGGPQVIIDTAVLRARWPDDAARVAARRAAWEAALPPAAGVPLYVDLAAPDLAAFESDFDAAVEARDAAATGRAGER